MGLPGRTELVLAVLTALTWYLQTNFTMGLSGSQVELGTDTLQGYIGNLLVLNWKLYHKQTILKKFTYLYTLYTTYQVC